MVYVYNRLDRLGDAALKEHLKFQRSITGQEVDQPTSTQCIDKIVQYNKAKRDLDGDSEVLRFFAPAANSMLAKAHLPLSSKKMAEDMSNKIFDVVRKSIEETNWIQQKSKKEMLKQVNTVQKNQMIAWSESVNSLDDNSINEYYKNFSQLEISDSFAKNKENILKDINKLPAEGPESSGPINLSNLGGKGTYMYISLGMMGDYNFVEDRPSIFNYANTGRIIGHEIGHLWGSGATGLFSDPETEKEFSKIVNCTIDLFNNYTITVGLYHTNIQTKPNHQVNGEQHPVDGELTLNENIPDISGLKVAYR